jgi:hypothetical protein
MDIRLVNEILRRALFADGRGQINNFPASSQKVNAFEINYPTQEIWRQLVPRSPRHRYC